MNVKYWVTFSALFVLLLMGYYLYLLNRQTYDIEFGISFNNVHAASLGLDWNEVYEAMMTDLQPKYVRISATWKEIEEVKGVFNFESLEWQMDVAHQHGAKVILVVGQKAPRWPECHIPAWVDYGKGESKQELLRYVEKTVLHFKDHPALEMWQVENEPFIRFQFGECERYDRKAIFDEIAIIKKLDQKHPTIVTDSGEMGLWWTAAHSGDFFGTTLYRVVRIPNGTIFRYDWLPAIVYRIKAWVTGVDMNRFFISELQAEPWFDTGDPTNTPIEVQEKTMDPDRLHKHIEFSRHVGAKRAYLWGVEWWYFMKQVHGDQRYWEIVRDIL
ncbi:beta-galactosidase [Candidatus Nomurabacteria bacterium]|nr:beta-galactosidase [Candidatus Nomurabacteria bacterium]